MPGTEAHGRGDRRRRVLEFATFLPRAPRNTETLSVLLACYDAILLIERQSRNYCIELLHTSLNGSNPFRVAYRLGNSEQG